jgi:CRISPR-associated protein Csm5
MAAEFRGRKTNVPYRRNKNSKEATVSYYEAINQGNRLEFTINNNYNHDVHSNLKLGNKIDLISIKNIKKSIYALSSDYIDNELKYSDEYGIDSLNKFYRSISKLNKKDSPLLKVGAGSGFLATTLAMKIQDYDPGLYDTIRKQKGGYDYCFPKSRKITKIGGKPLGWIQLDFKGE